MAAAETYTPNLTLLSKTGIEVIPFRPDKETTDSLLYRTALECGSVKKPFSYYAAEGPGFALLHLRAGALLLTTFPAEASVTMSDSGLLLLDCRFPRRIIVRSSAEYEILLFDGPSLACLGSQLPMETPFWQVPSSVTAFSELLPLFERKGSHPALCHMLLTTLLSRLILEHALPGKKVPSYLAAIKSELETCYYESFTLTELSQKHKVNKYRLCREFSDCFQCSPLQYLHRMRVQAAKDLLAETDLKVHEIGYEVGYENVNHFISHFKKTTGMTPGEYRCTLR